MKAHLSIWIAAAIMLLSVGCNKPKDTNTAADVPAAEANAEAPKADEAKAEEAKASEASLDKEIIKGVISVHVDAMRKCYEDELANNKDLAGKIDFSWEVAGDGTVKDVQVKDSSMKNEAVESCIAKEIANWKFPEPKGNGTVRIDYPFEFSPAEKADEAKADEAKADEAKADGAKADEAKAAEAKADEAKAAEAKAE